VTWLSAQQGSFFDLVYLDSLDTDRPGHAEHCLAEAQAALPLMEAGGLIAMDDTCWTRGSFRGKGALAVPWLLQQGWRILHSGYQTVLIRRGNG
jgi:hypothetical protein